MMADHGNEQEPETKLEETQVEKVEIDPSTLTPTSPEVISKYISRRLSRSMSNLLGKLQ
jgi:hypothetical protein